MKNDCKTVEAYIANFPKEIQFVLEKIRLIIKKAAPIATESISYGIIGYKTNGRPLVYFGAFKKHIGFYATPSGHAQFSKALLPYKQRKGSVQFTFDKEIPYDLITEMVLFRVKENQTKQV